VRRHLAGTASPCRGAFVPTPLQRRPHALAASADRPHRRAPAASRGSAAGLSHPAWPASERSRKQLALQVALDIVGADPDARLFQEVRERLGLGYDVGASLEVGPDWAVTVLSASAAREQERRLTDTIEHTCRDATRGFSKDEVRRAHRKLRYRFARLQDARLDRALAHATRTAMGQPSLPDTIELLTRIEQPEIEATWREMMRAPTLSGGTDVVRRLGCVLAMLLGVLPRARRAGGPRRVRAGGPPPRPRRGDRNDPARAREDARRALRHGRLPQRPGRADSLRDRRARAGAR
jgi:hypothetical protein